MNRFSTAYRVCLAGVLCLLGASVGMADVRFSVEQSVQVDDQDIPYSATVHLTESAPTQVGFEIDADLSGLQTALPGLLSLSLDETCRARLGLAMTQVLAKGDALTVAGGARVELFECQPLLADRSDRGAGIYDQALDVSLTASAQLRDECLFLRVDKAEVDLDKTSLLADRVPELDEEALEKARALVETATAILARLPICPRLPPEMVALDTQIDTGGTREIANGTLGAFVRGRIDVSASSIIALLNALQDRGVVPPAR